MPLLNGHIRYSFFGGQAMQLTTHTDYALRTLIYLSLRQDKLPTTIQEIADAYHISNNHVAKVAQTLVQLGYVQSLRGRSGGLVMAKPANEINVGELIRQTENLKLLDCFGTESSCPIDPACKLKNALGKAQAAFLQTLDQYNLADFTDNSDELRILLKQV
jgi:Rrf2 family nitric oxide-sensitive transcriptional repressor